MVSVSSAPRRLALRVQYDGTDFVGFQRQARGRSVQSVLEQAILELTGEREIHLHAAGRTDSGVHALGQVVTVDTECTIPTDKFPFALNAKLPEDVCITGAKEVPFSFHPRYDADGRVYHYRIDNQPFPNILYRRYAWHIRPRLDLESMYQAAQPLIGSHDFSSFAAAGSPMGPPIRELRRIEWTAEPPLIRCEVEANAFLYRMVRNIIGTLVEVGLGRLRPEEVAAILAARDRATAGPTAPPHGLCLVEVRYQGKSLFAES